MGILPRLVGAAAVVLTTAAVLTGCGVVAAAAPELSGDVFVHDPAYVQTDDGHFVYSTGNGQLGDGNIQIRRSDDGADWEYAGEVWASKPTWLADAVPGVDNLWAPELYEHGGTWYLYYSASTFGSSDSVIALATNTTLDPDDPDYEWVDRGEVIASAGSDFNAIDAGIVEDADGTPWMSFGSFSSGIRMVELEWPSGKRADAAEPLLLADRGLVENAIEAPYIVAHEGWFYLFASRGFCCKGIDSTYEIIVGRSKSVTGPYLDADGGALLDDGGTVVLTSEGDAIGPGGQSASAGMLAFHFYDGAADGVPTLGILPIAWRDGWPTVSWPDSGE
ncbi:arabinan endo-1,5-alpha-L-arabinosidase [Microbacterium sp. SD291]|uniref:arabinan endo-1,5-alpha-L-arabinosidase n=1 Tax=Microbacterium sp. SD291 TaxID=2782007 RepID=UPI001A95916C|nr:arabinan endo-1,5-alpha-L-arabinosidase [Microbacterium sp. SD291]MBO0979635.1 arabinan endo-1,5-alpha-L-arabinosidase [Microbacterium sp. SD291]